MLLGVHVKRHNSASGISVDLPATLKHPEMRKCFVPGSHPISKQQHYLATRQVISARSMKIPFTNDNIVAILKSGTL